MTASPRAPDLFLIGTQKGGSSSFFRLLVTHPGIGRMQVKECNIYSAGSPAAAHARLAAVPALPDQAARRYLLDASVDYSRFPRHPDVPATLRAAHPAPDQARFLYVLRNPVERLISNYFWIAQHYGLPGDLDTVLAEDPQYVATSQYDRQIEHWFAHFDPGQFFFVVSEQLLADPQAEMARLCAWLDLPPMEGPVVIPHRGATAKTTSRAPRSVLLNRLLWATPGLRRAVRWMLPDRTVRRATRWLTRDVPRKDPTRAEKRALLDRYFRDSIARTAVLTGKDLTAWLTAYDPIPEDKAPRQAP